jgi:hypothetical protein
MKSDYIIRAASSAGLLLNLTCLLLIAKNSKTFKSSYYRYLSCKIFFDACMCLLGLTFHSCYQPSCLQRQTFLAIFYRLYIAGLVFRSLRIGAYVSEIYLNLNRFYAISNVHNLCTSSNMTLYSMLVVLALLPWICIMATGTVKFSDLKILAWYGWRLLIASI